MFITNTLSVSTMIYDGIWDCEFCIAGELKGIQWNTVWTFLFSMHIHISTSCGDVDKGHDDRKVIHAYRMKS